MSTPLRGGGAPGPLEKAGSSSKSLNMMVKLPGGHEVNRDEIIKTLMEKLGGFNSNAGERWLHACNGCENKPPPPAPKPDKLQDLLRGANQQTLGQTYIGDGLTVLELSQLVQVGLVNEASLSPVQLEAIKDLGQ